MSLATPIIELLKPYSKEVKLEVLNALMLETQETKQKPKQEIKLNNKY